MKIDLSAVDLMALPVPDGPHGHVTYKDEKLNGFALAIDHTGKREFKMHAQVPDGVESQHPNDGSRPCRGMMYIVGVVGIDSEPVARGCAEILKRMADDGFLPYRPNDFAELDNLRVPDLQNVIRSMHREREEMLKFIAVIERDRQEMREWLEKE